MAGINVGGVAELPPPGGGPGFSVRNDDGVDIWVDIWIVPFGLGAPVQVTSAGPSDFYVAPARVSPNGLRVGYIDTTSPALGNLRVIDVDGSNDTLLVTVGANSIEDYFWIDNTTIVYQLGSGDLKRIDRDGTNGATIKTIANIASFCVNPAGTQLAYIVNVAGDDQLRVIDPDGTNEATLLSDLLMPSGSLPPAYRRDGSAIMFNYDSGMDTIKPDGTDQTNEVVTMPSGFWYPEGMSIDRFFYTDTTTFAQWKLGQIVFGSGQSLVSPTLYEKRTVQAAAPYVVQGRVFTIQDGSLMGGVDSLVSVLPDGSDLTDHFNPDESGAPLFQQLALES